nr:histone-lysine N-methyltransferase 2B isoform X1 [Nothobranchius furzeri]
MAASGGGFTSLSTAAGLGTHALPARARFPGRPCVTRSKLRSEKRTRRGRLVSADGELADGGPRPVNIGLALSEDPSLLRLLGLTEKHSRQKDAGFDSSNSEGEEDFTGFGTTKAGQQKSTVVVLQPSLRQAKAPRASEKPSGNKPLVGKIIPKTPKSSLIGKIVPRIPKEGQDVKESPVKDKETPQVSVKVQGKQEAPDAKIKNANKQTSGEQSRIKSADAVGKAGGAAGLTKHQEGVVSSLRSEKNAKQANRSNEGEVFEELDQSLTKGSLNIKGGFLMRHPRRSSEGVALTFASLHKRRWRRRTAQVTGVTPKAEVEAGPRSGQEAVMQLECKTVESSVKKVHKKRKVLLGYKRKPQTSIPGNSSPKIKKVRSRRVFYAYVPEPLPSVGGDHLQIQGQSAAPAGEEARSSLEQIDQSSNNSSTAVTSGRSSRVIKTPKRFLDEEIVPFPKGSLSTWLKSQQKDEFDGNSHPLDSDSTPVFDGTSGVSKIPGRSSPGASHIEIYKNLKKLTLKLAEKKKGQANVQEDYPHDGDRVTSPARKRRRPKIMMEELDSPGVVRKVAVVVEAEGESLKQIPSEDTGKEAEAASVREDSSEMLETAGPSHRIGLSGANKRMLHLLKKAKVQLIKIDQQKQLKLSQLSSKESQVPVSGKRRRRRRRVGLSSKEIPAQEQPLRGPRIKHVCRAAAVALGQPRAMVPDDIPRLSALPLHEREGITFSPTAEDVADDDDDDDDDDDIPEQGETQWAVSQESIPRRRRGRGHKFRRRKIMSGHGIRSRRCRVCTGCLVEEDCSKCINCLDKPKYGGPNTKRQCCIFKKCERIEKRKFDRAFKPLKIWARQYSGSTSGNESALGTREPDEGLAPTALGIKKHSLRKTKPRSYSKLLRSESEGEGEETTANKPDASSQDVAPQHGGLLLHDRRPFPKSASSRPRAHKCDFGTRLAGWLRQSPPSQEQENTEVAESRETLPESGSTGSPKLQKQLQIHLYRLPESVLKSAVLCSRWQPPQFVDRCGAQSQLIGQPATSLMSPPPELTKPETRPASPPSPLHNPDSSQKCPLLRLQHLPCSTMQSAFCRQRAVPSAPQKDLKPALHATPTKASSQMCSGGKESEATHPGSLMEKRKENTDKAAGQGVPETLSTVSPNLKEAVQEEKDSCEGRSEEDKDSSSVKETMLQRCPTTDPHCVLHSQSPADCASVNTLTGTTNGFPRRGLLQSKHKIRVDFKEDCAIQNVWLMGGLSVLSSVPTTPQPVCMLCASKGRHEMIFCQICCEPFHSFCLSSEERPHQESKENWCCRRCKFCNVCGRRNKSSKPVLQCRRCQTSYHPSCLGPTYPKPLNCYMPWVCMTCIRCKSCGVTPGKTWDMAWNHEQDLCPDCTALHKKGHFCTICLKCYEDSSQPSEMIQCLKCSHWIHHSCEGLSEELFGLLPNQTEKADFTCAPCRQKHTDKRSLKEELQGKLKAGLEEVLDVLLTSSSTRHLLVCKECLEMNVTPADQEQQQICDLKALEKKFRGDGYTSIKSFHLDVVSVMRKWIKEEERLPEDESLAAQSQAHYIQVMKQVFSCFPTFHLKKWNSFSEEFPSGMLPEAVLPPSKEHSYAQWVERTYQPKDPQADRVSSSLDVMQESSAQLNTSLCSKESIKTEDTRQCVLCQQYGDASPNEAGRLLYLGQNEWAHINCCLWSAEVNEQAGALLQVHSAVSRGRHLRCDHCGQSGATVGCYLSSCLSNFHFMCARVNKCVFLQDRKVYCYAHRELTSAKVVSGKGFEVPRRVYVDFDGINLKKKFLTGLEPESINMTIGSLQIQKLGVLSELSTVGRMLYPVGYQCSRLYWSTVDPRRHCKYTCKVTEVSTPLPGEEQDLKWDKEENHTIVHSPNHLRDSDMEYSDCFSSSSSPVKSTTPSPNSKAYDTAGPRSPGYSQARRPAGGSSRPLPSPGSVHYKSHHILTLRDLEDTRRPRRLSSRRRCSSSPTESNPSVPANLHSVRSRCSQFSPHPRSSNSPPLSPQNSTSPIFNSPPRSNSSPSVGLSPRRGAITHSPRGGQNFKITTPVSAEVPQDFLASSEAEDAAVATTNGISLAPDNLEEEVAHLMSQELPYTVFDTDVAVASMLNTKLEFEEALLAENLALNSAKAEVEGEDNQERGSDDEDSRHYGKLSRTVVSNAEGSSDETIQLLAASSISQLDGADGGSESDESEALEDEIKVHSIPDTPTKRLSVTLTRLEPLYASSQSNAEQQVTEVDSQETLSAPDFLDSRCVGNDLSLVEEEVSVTTPTFPKDVFRNSAADHFVSSVSDSVDILSSSSDDDKDEDNLSSDSSEVFKDDETDPDFHPELESKKSPTVVKKNTPESIPKQVLQRESCQFQPNVNSLTHRLGHVPSAPAMFCSVQRPVTSPIVINGLNTLPGQAGPTQGRRIAIRLDTSKPGGQPQKEVIQNQAEEANSPAPPAPARQVLLVNRQGQILLKDPLTNTFQALSSNSPAYNRISQIAKILHNRNSVSSVPRVIIKSPSSPSNPNATPMSNCATLEKKIIVKMLPVKSSLLSASPAPVGIQTVPKQSVSNTQRNPAQAIIDRAMASHRDASRPKPIILGSNRQRKLGHQGPPQVPHMNNSDESSVGHSRSSSVFSRVRVRRMPPVSERHSKKKTKIELLKDLSSEPEEIQEARTSGVRMKAPTVSDVLDLNHESKSNPVRIMAPPLPASSRRPPSLPQSRFDLETKTHTWVSSRHGDLSAWGPYTGCSSEEEAPALKHRKKTRMNQPHLRFEITSDDGFSVMANSIEVAWRAVIDSVLEARAEFHLKQLPLGVMSGPRMLGVIHDAVIFLLEQLEGAANCRQHRFRFHCCDDVEEELPLNPSGCARAEVYTRKATFDMFNFLASQHRALPNLVGQFDEDDDEFPLKGSRRATSSELPMAMRFRHLEKISKEAVGVYRSPIHGRGLFCKRNIEAGEMVIEYAGTVIRSVLTDKREKYYDGKGIGCYMFRIDDFDVVDATMQGNAARFINHSCEPNCYSRVINVDGRKHIVIFALRKIYRGEELTYDYKFPIEDDENKLRCNCGARRCRRYLN